MEHHTADKLLRIFTLIVLSTLASAVYSQDGKKITVEQVMVPKVTLTDQKLISFFVSEFFLPETLVTKIDIIDATGNGFGEKDLAIAHPSGEIYSIFPSDGAQKIMNNWKFTPNFQIVGENIDPEVYESLPTDRAANNIFSALLKGIERNYTGGPIKIRMERLGMNTVFEMWGYEDRRLDYKPAPVTPTSDVMYIYTTVKDTVYVEK
ncbi:MAG: hypothetical protein ACE5I1_20045 [bacterium]